MSHQCLATLPFLPEQQAINSPCEGPPPQEGEGDRLRWQMALRGIYINKLY
jgi:hypothetical protein